MLLNNVINGTSFLCPVCKVLRYSSIQTLKTHLMNDHKNLECQQKEKHRLNYTCPTCNRVLVRDSKYGEHLINKPSLRHRWKCKLCVNTTTILNSIMHKLLHVQSEHNMFPNKCFHCFKAPWRIQPEYQNCTYCDKYLIASYMYRHCIVHHLEEIPFCNLCSRYFIDEKSYALHLRKDSGYYGRLCKVYGQKNKIIQVNKTYL